MPGDRDGSRTRSQNKEFVSTAQFDELKSSLDEINSKLNDLGDLKALVQTLREQNEAKDRKIEELKQRVDDLEQYTRQDDIIITGLKTRHKSYARATITNEMLDNQNAPDDELTTLEGQVSSFIENQMGIQLTESDISVCHTLPGRKDIPNIVVRFTCRKIKNKILKHARHLKGTNIYLNEHLSAKNQELAATARKLRKEQKVLNTWTRNCQIFIKLKNDGGTKIIREKKDLRDLGLV